MSKDILTLTDYESNGDTIEFVKQYESVLVALDARGPYVDCEVYFTIKQVDIKRLIRHLTSIDKLIEDENNE